MLACRPEPFSNQVGNLLKLAFPEIVVKALQAGLNRLSGHMWPPGLVCSPFFYGKPLCVFRVAGLMW